MTSIVAVRGTNGIFIVSDGIVYNDDGCALGFTTKVYPLIHMNAAIAASGAGGIGAMVCARLKSSIYTFDALKAELPDHFADVMKDYNRYYQRWSTKSTLLVAGWSDENQAFETFAINAHEKQAKDALTGELTELEPYILRKIDYVWASHYARKPSYETVGIPFPMIENSGFEPDELAIRMVCASRLDSRELEDGETSEEDATSFNVGGFIQTTWIERDLITQKIIHRWPDNIDERVDPSSGDLIPPFLMNKQQEAASEQT